MTTVISIQDVCREVNILKLLSGHKLLVKFYDAGENVNNVYIVVDRRGRYSEEVAKLIIVQILNVVAFCHLQRV
jgi:serine/threonine protein kinase